MTRLLRAASLGGLLLPALTLQAADPAAITLTPANQRDQAVAFTLNASEDPTFGLGTLFGLLPAACAEGCDILELNLDLPPGYNAANPDAHVEVEINFDAAASSAVMLLNPGGAMYALDDSLSATSKTLKLRSRDGRDRILVALAADISAVSANGIAYLRNIPDAPRNDALPYAAAGQGPSFDNHVPDVQGLGLFGGEATIDVNWNTGSVFYIGFLETLRVKFDDMTSPATSIWENKSGTLNSLTTSDPILVGDPQTGRIFAQQLIVGEGQSLSEYSDDDGETWIPGGGGAILRSGADHQSLGVGPYPTTGLGALIPHPLYPNAVYYCSQDVATAYCSRSDDGGLTFAPSVPLYTVNQCVGLHGHPKVAPDGTVYVPNKGCEFDGTPLVNAARTAVVVSEDAGLTWDVRVVPDSVGGLPTADPSVAVGSDGTVYLAWVDAGSRRLHAAVSGDKGETWTNNVDVGAIAGVRFADFPAVIAGDGDRAAIAFLGSPYTGDEPPGLEPGIATGQAVSFDDPSTTMSFQGYWYIYVATTYDRGQTWFVTDATNGNPAQGPGGVGNGGTNRNLLDFFDVTVDPQGRILVSYEDGCVGSCADGGASTFNDFAVIARQSAGRRLFAEFDEAAAAAQAPPPPVPPAPDYSSACSLPGFTISDRTGEAEAQPPTRDVASFSIAEPSDQPGKLIFTITTAARPLPLHRYQIYFDVLGEHRRYLLDLTESGASASYFDGGFAISEDGMGTESWAYVTDPARSLESGAIVDGSVVQFVIDKASWNLTPGTVLQGVMAWTFPTSASSSNITREEAGYEISYPIRQADACDGRVASRGGAVGSSRGGVMSAWWLLVLLCGIAARRRRAR